MNTSSELTTKGDITGIKGDITEIRAALTEIKNEMAEITAELKIMNWVGLAILCGTVALVLEAYF